MPRKTTIVVAVTWLSLNALGWLIPSASHAQVAITPTTILPGGWERISLRAVNQTGPGITEVRLVVPEIVGIIGVEPLSGWALARTAATDTTPQTLTWSGGPILPGEFIEFAFLGRVAADARRKELVFPVRLTKEDGSVVSWDSTNGDAPPLRVQIRGSTRVTPWGAVGLAGGAFGLSVLALVLALAGRKLRGGVDRETRNEKRETRNEIGNRES